MNVITLNYAATHITEVKWHAWSKTTLNYTHRHQDSPQLQVLVERRERTTYKRQRQSWWKTGREISSAGKLGMSQYLAQAQYQQGTVSIIHQWSSDPEIQAIIHQWSSYPSHHPPVSQWALLEYNTSEHAIDHSISTSDHCLNPLVGWISNPCSQNEH